jgi:hypothetical protein
MAREELIQISQISPTPLWSVSMKGILNRKIGIKLSDVERNHRILHLALHVTVEPYKNAPRG